VLQGIKFGAMLYSAKFVLKSVPNPACSGHGFAVRQSRRFPAKKLSPAKLLAKHAVPLTQSLGIVPKSCFYGVRFSETYLPN